MRISSSSSPTVLQRLPDGAREDVAPATDDGIAQETLPAAAHSSGSGGRDWSGIGLEAQLQKSALASLRVPPFQALPRVFADLKVLKFPTAGLQKPKPAMVSRLSGWLKSARTAAESGSEQGRTAVNKVLETTVKAYGIGQDGVTGLKFDPTLSLQGGTIGSSPRSFIVIGKSALDSPEELASTILHESSHVYRNNELAAGGIDRDKLSVSAEEIYSALIEIEGYQLEIDNAKTLGTSASYVKGAENLKDHYLHELEVFAGKDWRALAEKGQFQQLHEKFRQDQLKKK